MSIEEDSVSIASSRISRKSSLASVGGKSFRKNSQASLRSEASTVTAISDIEADDRIKKLTRDKKDLKQKLRNLIAEVENRSQEYKRELDRTQAYFKRQLEDVIQERNKARDEIEKIRNVMLDERERANFETEQKLEKQKEIIETRYDSQIVSRLENTIKNLQDKLSKLQKDRETQKQVAEQLLHERQTASTIAIHTLEDELRVAREELAHEQAKYEHTLLLHNNEKQTFEAQLKKEKIEEISKLLYEKDTTITVLKTERDEAEKRLKNMEKEKADLQTQNKFELERMRIDYEQRILNSNASFCQKIEEMQANQSGKLFEAIRVSKQEIDQKDQECVKVIDTMRHEYAKKFDAFADNAKRVQDELHHKVSKLESELSTTREMLGQDTIQRDLTLRRKYEEEMSNVKLECRTLIDSKNKELDSERLRTAKNIGERDDIIFNLKDQIQKLQSNLKKMQDGAREMNAQFNLVLEKQRSQAETAIQNLEFQIQKVNKESFENLNILQEEIRSRDKKIAGLEDMLKK